MHYIEGKRFPEAFSSLCSEQFLLINIAISAGEVNSLTPSCSPPPSSHQTLATPTFPALRLRHCLYSWILNACHGILIHWHSLLNKRMTNTMGKICYVYDMMFCVLVPCQCYTQVKGLLSLSRSFSSIVIFTYLYILIPSSYIYCRTVASCYHGRIVV